MKIILDLKVVMDTNVFVSGVFFSGPPYQILKAWQSGEFELVVSQDILDEYRRVGEILAEERPNIDVNPILNLSLSTQKFTSLPNSKNPFAKTPTTISSLPVH